MVLRSRRKSIWITRLIWNRVIDVPDGRLWGVFFTHSLSLSLSLSRFPPWSYYNVRTLGSRERRASPNCFTSLWRIADDWIPSAVTNLVMRRSTLNNIFRSLISLVKLRQDYTSSQLPEREGERRNVTLPRSVTYWLVFHAHKKINLVHIWTTL